MADAVVTPKEGAADTTTREGLDANNAAVIAANANQDINVQPAIGDLNATSGDSLDSLRDKIVAEKQAAADLTDPVKKAAAEQAAKDEAARVAREKEQAELQTKAAAGDADAAAAVQRAKEESDRVAAEQKAKDEEQARLKTRADEIFKDSPTLAPNAAPRSGEAFAAVKLKAAQEISARDAKIAEYEKLIADYKQKAEKPLPEAVEKELNELRDFRTKLDIDYDPKWKTFDDKVNSAREFIYAQLKRSPAVSEKTLADIRSIGGPDLVNMDKLFESINDPTMKRIVDAKVADIEQIKFDKDQAIASAKADVAKYRQEQEKNWQQAATSHNDRTRSILNDISSKIPWLNNTQADPKAKDAAVEAKRVEAHNKSVETFRSEIEQAMQDDSPDMRATLMIGMVNGFRQQAIAASLSTEVTRLNAALTEANAQIEKLKSSGAQRLRTSGAPEGGAIVPAKPAGIDVNEKAGDALDRMRAERAKAQASV